MPPDFVFDSDLTSGTMARYPLLLMPLSQALSDRQVQAVIDFVRGGGTVLLGMGTGELDAEAQPRGANPLGAVFGFAFGRLPEPLEKASPRRQWVPTAGGDAVWVCGPRATLTMRTADWQILYREGLGADAPPAAAVRPFGRGRVLVLNSDPVAVYGSTFAAEGRTRMDITDETAAAGRYSLRCTDHPIAPQTFHPDLETKVPPFTRPDFTGGELNCDLRLGTKANVSIAIRTTDGRPIQGPVVRLPAGGKAHSGGQALWDVPVDTWFHLRVDYRFGDADRDSTYRLSVTLPDGGTRAADLTVAKPWYCKAAYCATDWVVIFGAGKVPATFYLDNVELTALGADGSRKIVHRLDFEEGPALTLGPTHLVRQLGRLLKMWVPPPIAVDAPPEIRAGFFRRDPGKVLVHLYNHNALRRDWQKATGPPVRLRCRPPINAARLVFSDRALPVHQGDAGGSLVEIPHVGLYEVIEVQQQ